MTAKRFTEVWCSETGHIGITDNGVDKEFTGSEFEDLLNGLNDENQAIQKKVFRLIDWLETEKGVSREETKNGWYFKAKPPCLIFTCANCPYLDYPFCTYRKED